MMKRFWRVCKYLLLALIALILLLIITTIVARFIHVRQTEITGENGVQDSRFLEIGGARQYLQIRGEDKGNPVILVLHGGPGSPMSYYSYFWQTDLEDNFTVVHWDQRGCGRTYYANDVQTIEAATTELLLADLDEIVTYLTKRFEQNKVIILGHSWGTVLGSLYVQNHPEKVEAYIAVGQTVNSVKGDLISAEEAAKLAQKAGEESKAESILVAYDDIKSGSSDLKKIMMLRAQTSEYLPSGDNMSALEQLWMGATSPYMGLEDLKWYLYAMTDFNGFINANQTLFKQLFENDGFNLYDYPQEYEVPVYFISGDSDWITPYTLVQDYYEDIDTPQKEMIMLTKAGHSPFLDRKDDFCQAIKNVLLPYITKPGAS